MWWIAANDSPPPADVPPMAIFPGREVLQHLAVDGHDIVDGGRKRMLGRHAIVHGDRQYPGGRSDDRRLGHSVNAAAEDVRTTVDVQEHVTLVGWPSTALRPDQVHRDVAVFARFDCDAGLFGERFQVGLTRKLGGQGAPFLGRRRLHGLALRHRRCG